jgi:hypothetical protein
MPHITEEYLERHMEAQLSRFSPERRRKVEEAAGRAGRYLRRVTFLTGREEPRYENGTFKSLEHRTCPV